jgi:hypothetical protein
LRQLSLKTLPNNISKKEKKGTLGKIANLHKSKMAAFAYIFTMIYYTNTWIWDKYSNDYHNQLKFCVDMLTKYIFKTIGQLKLQTCCHFPRWPPFSRQNPVFHLDSRLFMNISVLMCMFEAVLNHT